MRVTLWMITTMSGIDKLQNSSKQKKPKKNKEMNQENIETVTDSLNGSTSGNKMELDKINFDTILVFQNEPNKLVLMLSALVFNVNIDLHVFDGSISKEKQHDLSYNKTRFTASNINELPVITLCYFMSNYHLVYNKQFSDKHSFYLVRHLVNEADVNVQIKNDINCDKCQKETKKIYLKKNTVMSCYDCLRSHLDKLIEKRAEALLIEEFNNRECKNT